MRMVYIIFASVGWSWLAVAAAILWWRLRRTASPATTPAGREVLTPDAQ